MDTKPRASNGAASRSSSAAAMANKSSKRQASRNEKKQNKRRGDKELSKRKKPAELGHYGGAEVDTSDDEDLEGSQREYSQPPEIGDEIAVKCPPDPPYPEGWYTGVVTDVIVHGEEDLNASASKGGRNYVRKSARKVKTNFTITVEWDGGGDEEIYNPEWRLKGDAPDKQGRVSHRDAKLRPYFKYWVTRLNAMNEAEKKLGRSRAGKNTRVDPDQKVEWIQCSSPSCGKWRPLPSFIKSSAILESCNNKWFCVLNSWDEAHASCGAAQETGYMPPHQG